MAKEKQSDDSSTEKISGVEASALAAAAAAEEAEPADTEEAEPADTEQADPAATDEGAVVAGDSGDEDFSASVSSDSEEIVVHDGTEEGAVVGTGDENDVTLSDDSAELVASDEGTEPDQLVDPRDLEEADFPINDIKIGNRSQFADRVVDPSSSVIPNDLQFVQGSVLQGPERPTEDEERELLEVRRGTMEPPDLPGPPVPGDDADVEESAFAADQFPAFGAGSGVASTEPDVSEEATSGVEPSRFALLQEPPPVTFEDSGEGEPHEIQIDSTENFGEPTEFPIDGEPAEPPPDDAPPDPDA